MGYVEHVLAADERVLHVGRFHWMETLSALVLCLVIIGFFRILAIWATEMAITNKRLIYKRGLIARKTEEINLHRIEEVNLHQGVLGRLLGYGKIRINGTGGNVIALPNIAGPLRFKNELQAAQVAHGYLPRTDQPA